jgi:hypothetical protein
LRIRIGDREDVSAGRRIELVRWWRRGTPIPLLPKGFHYVHGDRGAVRCTSTSSLGDAPID